MNIFTNILEFYKAAPQNPLILTLIFWLIWPGIMIPIGLIFESRMIPLWNRQARAFIPGDLTFGVMLTAIVGMYAASGEVEVAKSPIWWAIAVALAFGVGCNLRQADARNYSPRARISPTKVTHDVVGYFVIPALLIGLLVPQIVHQVTGVVTFNMGLAFDRCWLAIVISLMVYIACVLLDTVNGYGQFDVYARHPYDWAPIWCKKKK